MKISTKVLSTLAILLMSNTIFALRSAPEVPLGPIVVPAGGKTTAELSLQPIHDYVRSLWDIKCSSHNPASNDVIMQFGIEMVLYSSWPPVSLNGQSMGIMGNPQGALKPGDNAYILNGVDNKGFSKLYFTNFDTTQDVSFICTATLSQN